MKSLGVGGSRQTCAWLSTHLTSAVIPTTGGDFTWVGARGGSGAFVLDPMFVHVHQVPGQTELLRAVVGGGH